MDIVTTVNLLLQLADNVVAKLPDTDQELLMDYMRIKREYLYEAAQNYEERDDQLIDTLWDELLVAIQGVSQKIPEENL